LPEASVHIASTDADFAAARGLSHAWVDWLLKTYPALKTEILRKFEPVSYGRTVDNLHIIHARPRGAICRPVLINSRWVV
jgi:hypothetical protein